MLDLALKLIQGGLHRRVHRLKVTAVLLLAGAAFLAVAIGFGVSLLTVWLQLLYGTMIAYAIVGGGCAVIGLILFAAAFWRGPSPRRAAPQETAAPDADAAKRSFDEALAAVQHGSRESMLAALALALVAGLTLARRH